MGRTIHAVIALDLLATMLAAQRRPRFEDYPVQENWDGRRAPLQLRSASERLFKTNLRNAAAEPPNFAGHYVLATWGCGSNCAAGAFIDLATGRIMQPPHTHGSTGWERWIFKGGMYNGSALTTRVDSRLFLLRTGLNYIEEIDDVVPDSYYFVLESGRFRLIRHIRADRSAVPRKAPPKPDTTNTHRTQ